MTEGTMKKVSILSLGWLGTAIYKRLSQKGFELSGSFNSTPKELANEFKFDINTNELSNFILQSDIVIFNIPPSKIVDDAQLIRFIKKIAHKKLIFISSTSVYGHQGSVNEKTKPIPETINGKRLLKWEQAIQEQVAHYQIIRSAGQFGPGRHPGKSLSGRTDLSGGNQFINLISQVDLLDIIDLSLQDTNSKIINAVNTHHPLKKDYYQGYCELHKLVIPHFSEEQNLNSKKVNTIYKDFEMNSDLN